MQSYLADLALVPAGRESQSIFFRSFLLSQGNTDIQQDLFFYIALIYPAWRLGDEETRALREASQPLIERYLASGWHDPVRFVRDPDDAADFEAEVTSQIYALASALASGCPLTREDLLRSLLSAIVDADHQFLVKQGGRFRLAVSSSIRGTSVHAPFYSHFLQFGLLHRPTGAAVFDQLFAELATVYRQRMAVFWQAMRHDDVARHLVEVIACHNQAYPDQVFALPSLEAPREREG